MFTWLDPIILIGLFISISISVGMVLTGNDTLSGLIVGLLSSIITLLIDVIARIHNSQETLLKATNLSELFADKLIGEKIQEIASFYIAIKKYEFEHYQKIANTTLDDCKTRLKELSSGAIIIDSETPISYGNRGKQYALQTIKVAWIGTMEKWKTEKGKKFLELDKAAIKRGVKVTRVFGITQQEARDFLELLKEQEKIGIQVSIVDPERINSLYMIYDDKILIDFSVNKDKTKRDLEEIVVDPSRVIKKVEEFNNILFRYGKSIKQIQQ